MGDRVQLQQVMINLIVNSVEAMKDVDGTRELAIKSQRRDDRQLMVSVSDTGLGLPAQKDRIFDAFFTTKIQGSAWGFGSAARSSNPMVAAYGLRTTLRAAQSSTQRCLLMPKHIGNARGWY
jgi:C4-dicarboxylate-specific signal transduction histidine kinase